MATTITKIAATFLMAAISASTTDAFGVNQRQTVLRPRTALNLERDIAEMIDKEIYRLQHKVQADKQFQEKNKKVVEKPLPKNFDFGETDFTDDNIRMKLKDKRLAKKDPQAYCADRCVTTGNCDVYEDLYSMTPSEVMKFCTECVLSEGEEPCDVPESMLNP